MFQLSGSPFSTPSLRGLFLPCLSRLTSYITISIHSTTILLEQLLCARYCPRCQRYKVSKIKEVPDFMRLRIQDPDINKIITHTQETLCLVAQSCPTFCNPLDCSFPGSSVHGDSPDKNNGVGSLSLLQGIFPTQESNWSLLHCRWILYQLSYQGSPISMNVTVQKSKLRNQIHLRF